MFTSFFLNHRFGIFGIVFVLLASCSSHHAYVGMPAGQPMRDVAIPSGNTVFIPIGAPFIGVAYEESSDHIFLRIIPGTQLQELDRTGTRIRSFPAQQVTAGCDGILAGNDSPAKECGLAMRYSDRHFFLDHPGGLLIAELDFNGVFIRNIRLAQPDGPIGGLAYDQKTDTIYILFVRSRMLAEIDLDGVQLRRFSTVNPQTRTTILVERFGLSISSQRRELYLALHNSNRLGVFDLNGSLVEQHPLNSGVTVQGIGAGRR